MQQPHGIATFAACGQHTQALHPLMQHPLLHIRHARTCSVQATPISTRCTAIASQPAAGRAEKAVYIRPQHSQRRGQLQSAAAVWAPAAGAVQHGSRRCHSEHARLCRSQLPATKATRLSAAHRGQTAGPGATSFWCAAPACRPGSPCAGRRRRRRRCTGGDKCTKHKHHPRSEDQVRGAKDSSSKRLEKRRDKAKLHQ